MLRGFLIMRIKLLRGCIVPGHPDVAPGDVFEISPDIANRLIALRKAEPVNEPIAEASSASIETREPVAEARDPLVSMPTADLIRKPRGRPPGRKSSK